MARVVMVILALAVTIYAVADCARTPSEKIPGRIPKALILILIMLLTPIGAVAWIVISRVAAAEASDGQVRPTVWSSPDAAVRVRPSTQRPPAPLAPDDDPEFLWRLEKELYRRRQESAHPTAEGRPPAPDAQAFDSEDDSAAGQTSAADGGVTSGGMISPNDSPADTADQPRADQGGDEPGADQGQGDDDNPPVPAPPA